MKRIQMIRAVFLALMLMLATAFKFVPEVTGSQNPREFATLGYGPMSAQNLQENIDQALPVYLLVLYAAFNQADEHSIYDTLASVAAGDALKDVYLTRASTLAGGGMQEGTQNIHEIDLLSAEVARSGDELAVAAIWQVVGTVGHAEHTHVRGGEYAAELNFAPVDEAWKITRFELDEAPENLAALQSQ